MKRISALFSPLIFPFMLTLLVIGGLYFENRQQRMFELEHTRQVWQEKAANMIEEIRMGCRFDAQIRRFGHSMKRWFRGITNPQFRLTGKTLLLNLKKFFPKTHFPLKTKVYGFSFNRKNELETLNYPGLEKSSGRVIADILTKCLDPERLPKAGIARLNKRIQTFFGENLDFECLSRPLSGQLFPGSYLGKEYLIFWDFIYTQKKRIGAYLIYLPFDTRKLARPMAYALSRAKRQYPGIIPLLIPYTGEQRYFPPIFPRGVNLNRVLKQKLREIIPKSFKERDRDFPCLKKSEVWKGFWVMRDVLIAEKPNEIWLVGNVPKLPSSRHLTGIFVFCLASGLIWLTLVMRVWQSGEAPSITVRHWMMLFVTFLGLLSMVTFFSFGTFYIENASIRKIDDEVTALREKFSDLDSKVTSVLERHSRVFKDLVFDRKWSREIMHSEPKRREKLFSQTFRKLMNDRQNSIQLEGVLVYRFAPTVEFFSIGSFYASRKQINNLLGFFEQFIFGVVEQFQGVGNIEKIIQESHKKGGLSGVLKGTLEDIAYPQFFSIRQEAELFANESTVGIIFYDFIASKGEFQGVIFLIAKIEDSYAQVLQETLTKSNLESKGNIFSFGRIEEGGFRPIIPLDEKFWNSISGKNLRKIMNSASEARGERSAQTRRKIYLAWPCRQLKNFVLGGAVSLEKILSEKRAQRYILYGFLGLLFVVIFVLGLATTNHLLIPLGEVEAGLLSVGQGNLDIRLGRQRNDELGDLCLAFDRMIQGIQERRELGRYVSSQLDTLVKTVQGDEEMIPSAQRGAVLVSDLREFTTLSEIHPTKEIIQMLNHHHQAMAEVIPEYGGSVELFIGDAVVAFFPDKPGENGNSDPLRAAEEMMKKHLLIQQLRREKELFTYEIGIGIDYGDVMTGSLVSADRREFVVIGHVRTNAENLEALTKQGKHSKIVLSEATVERFSTAKVDRVSNEDAWELILESA